MQLLANAAVWLRTAGKGILNYVGDVGYVPLCIDQDGTRWKNVKHSEVQAFH